MEKGISSGWEERDFKKRGRVFPRRLCFNLRKGFHNTFKKGGPPSGPVGGGGFTSVSLHEEWRRALMEEEKETHGCRKEPKRKRRKMWNY